MAQFSQSSFAGGLNLLFDPSKTQDNEYPRLKNARSRYDTLKPIKQPLQVTLGLPSSGLMQGCYAAANYILVFVAGQAYWRDCSVDGSAFNQIPGFQMSATQPVIYAELVPASSINLSRQLSDTAASSPLERISTISGTPAVVLCQDGQNQPWVILQNGTARITQNFQQWTPDNPEYVPIGYQMAYVPQEGVLYIVLANPTTNNYIARSVTGQPLNFVIAIDAAGNKLSSGGEAIDLSFGVSYDAITALKATNSNEGTLFVGTLRSSLMVQPNQDPATFIYGEPSVFQTTPLFSTGPLNQFSVVELLGDMALIDFSGLRAFNAVLQAKREGQNTTFSASVAQLFEGIVQTNPVAYNFDDYALFAVNTIFGYMVIVYDTINQKYVSTDIWTLGENEYIKQFAEVKTGSGRKLFFITSENKLYQAFASSAIEEAVVYIGEWTATAKSTELQPTAAQVNLIDIYETGMIYATYIVDNVATQTQGQPIRQEDLSQPNPPFSFPLGQTTIDIAKTLTLNFPQSATGTKIGLLITWAFNATLLSAEVIANEQQSLVTIEQQAAMQTQNNPSPVRVDTISPALSVAVNTVISLRGVGFNRVQSIKLGSTTINAFNIISDNVLTFVASTITEGHVKLFFSGGFTESADVLTVHA